MLDYSNGKIYCIRSNVNDEIYIGSTCQSLAVRMAGHRRDYKQFLAGKYHNVTSFNILKNDGAYIELIELFPCNTKEELNRREGQLIRETACVNARIAGRTLAEWRQDNKVAIVEKGKEYRQDNKVAIAERMKEYQQKNKVAIAEKKKEYRQENKVAIAEKRKEKHDCLCGGHYRTADISRHIKTKRHQASL